MERTKYYPVSGVRSRCCPRIRILNHFFGVSNVSPKFAANQKSLAQSVQGISANRAADLLIQTLVQRQERNVIP